MKLKRIFIYYSGALLQGVCMVIIPAASTILKSQENGITDSQYGVLTIPMILAGIIGTLLVSRIVNRWGRKKAYFLGIFLNLLFLITIAGTYYAEGNNQFCFHLASCGECFLGSWSWDFCSYSQYSYDQHSSRKRVILYLQAFMPS